MSNNLPNTLIDNNSEIVTPPWAVPALEVLEQMLEKRRENWPLHPDGRTGGEVNV